MTEPRRAGPSAPHRVAELAQRLWRWGLGLATPVNAISAGLFFVSLGGLYLHLTGAMDSTKAMALIVFPAIAAAALLRPAWVVLALLVAPPDLLSSVTPRLLLFGVLGALAALAAREDKIHLGWSTGTYPIIAMLVYAAFRPSDVSGAGADVADGILKLTQYYVALMLLTYNAVRLRAVTIRNLATALLVGGVGTAVLSLVDAGPLAGPFSSGRTAAYLTAMGLLVAFGRLVLGRRDHEEPNQMGLNIALVALLGLVTAQQLVRATWVSILIAFVLMAIWTSKTRWLIAIPLVATLILAVPVSRERILPDDLGAKTNLAEYTTGRWVLWEALVDESAKAMPLGHGWGHWYSLTPEELFGFRSFVDEGNDTTYVYAHNDWLYLSVDLGLVGVGLLTLFWIQLGLTLRKLGRREGPTRDAAVVLVGASTVYLLVQLVDNGFALQPVAERFFIIAGAVFAVRAVMAQETRAEAAGQAVPSVATTPAWRG